MPNIIERSRNQQANRHQPGASLFSFFGQPQTPGQLYEEDRYLINGREVPWTRKARFMRKDPTIQFLRLMFAGRLISNDYYVEHDKDVPTEVVELVRANVKQSWGELVKHASFGCMDFGWQPFEMIYRLSDGYWMVDKVKPLLQDITTILQAKRTGDFMGFAQGGDRFRIEDGGICLINFLQEGTYWYGHAPLKALNMPFDKQFSLYVQVDKHDGRLAANHWVLYYPVGRTKVDQSKDDSDDDAWIDNFELAQQIMNNLLSFGSMVVPSSIADDLAALNEIGSMQKGEWKAELLSGGETGAASYGDRLRYYDTLYARGMGFPERAVFEGQFGTKAESEVQGETSNVITSIYMQDINRGLNEYFIPDVIRTNFGSRYAKQVRIGQNPISASEKQFYRGLYERLMTDPDVLMLEHEQMDMTALRESLGVPVNEDTDVESETEGGVSLDVSDLQDG